MTPAAKRPGAPLATTTTITLADRNDRASGISKFVGSSISLRGFGTKSLRSTPLPSAPPLVADPRPESAARRAEAYCGTTRS